MKNEKTQLIFDKNPSRPATFHGPKIDPITFMMQWKFQ